MCFKKYIEKLHTCPVGTRICQTIPFLDKWGMGVVMLSVRFWLASLFFASALTKIYTDTAFGFIPYFNLTDTTFFLFEDEYGMPFPMFTAWLATLVELIAPIMLILGFGSRLAGLALLLMTLVIHFTYIMDDTHYVWMILSALCFCYGSGIFSLDYALIRKCPFKK